MNESNINKELLKDYFKGEAFLSFLENEGIDVIRKGKGYVCRSPFRYDKKPGCTINLKMGTITDWADNAKTYDAFSIIANRYNLSTQGADFYEILKIACDYAGYDYYEMFDIDDEIWKLSHKDFQQDKFGLGEFEKAPLKYKEYELLGLKAQTTNVKIYKEELDYKPLSIQIDNPFSYIPDNLFLSALDKQNLEEINVFERVDMASNQLKNIRTIRQTEPVLCPNYLEYELQEFSMQKFWEEDPLGYYNLVISKSFEKINELSQQADSLSNKKIAEYQKKNYILKQIKQINTLRDKIVDSLSKFKDKYPEWEQNDCNKWLKQIQAKQAYEKQIIIRRNNIALSKRVTNIIRINKRNLNNTDIDTETLNALDDYLIEFQICIQKIDIDLPNDKYRLEVQNYIKKSEPLFQQIIEMAKQYRIINKLSPELQKFAKIEQEKKSKNIEENAIER